MSEETCPDCGRAFGTEVQFDSAERIVCGMGPGMRNSAYHYDGFALGLCRVDTIERLRSQLSAATARASELEMDPRRVPEWVHEQGERLIAYTAAIERLACAAEGREERAERPSPSEAEALVSHVIARVAALKAEAAETLALLGRGIQLMDGEDELRALVAQRDVELAAMARECEAWRKLAEWGSTSNDHRVEMPYGNINGRWIIFANIRTVDENDETVENSLHERGLGDTPQAAAIDLATKLGLIAPDGKGETKP